MAMAMLHHHHGISAADASPVVPQRKASSHSIATINCIDGQRFNKLHLVSTRLRHIPIIGIGHVHPNDFSRRRCRRCSARRRAIGIDIGVERRCGIFINSSS